MNFEALLPIVASDAKERGVSALCRARFWDSALRLFIKASRVLIITGFYNKDAGAPETDGPPGAVALGRALIRTGKSAAVLTDSRNFSCLKACSRSVNGPMVISADSHEKIPTDIDLLVFIERPGHAADGRYYDMRGIDISSVTAQLDRVSETARSRGIPVVGIGDGGNEAGMGLLYDVLAARLPSYAPSLSKVTASVCLPVDLSNWGAYALTAALSVFYRRWLGLDDGEESVMLSAVLDSGAVDGVIGRPALSVDGIEMKNLECANSSIRNWYSENFGI